MCREIENIVNEQYDERQRNSAARRQETRANREYQSATLNNDPLLDTGIFPSHPGFNLTWTNSEFFIIRIVKNIPMDFLAPEIQMFPDSRHVVQANMQQISDTADHQPWTSAANRTQESDDLLDLYAYFILILLSREKNV